MAKFSAFISHKTEDQSIAQALKLALETLSKHKMIVHHSGEVATGDVWRKWIDDRVLESQVLIFLYTTMERNRGWRWCFFAIGMFRGNKMLGEETSNQNIYCIKHPEIPEPPSPIEHIQVCNADEKSLSELFRQLIYSKGVFSSEALVEDPLITEGDVAKFNKEVKKVVKAFTPPVQVSFFEKRLEINLSKIVEDEIVESSINDAELSGNESTMRFLNIQEGTKWQKLYGKFQAWGEHTWLDQVRDSIDRIKRQEDPIDVLHPFKMPNGKTYIPVVTRS